MGGFGDFMMGTEGTPGEHGIDVAYIDDYEDYQGYRDVVGGWTKGVLSGAKEGQGAFMNEYLPGIQKQQEEAIQRYYMGEGNNRSNSVMGLAGQTGAATGVGPKATMAYQGKVGQDMGAKLTESKAAIDRYKANWMGEANFKSLDTINDMKQGQRYHAAAYNIEPTAGTEGFLSKAVSGLAGAGLSVATGGMSNMMTAGMTSMFPSSAAV
jgi:hypothetical protein